MNHYKVSYRACDEILYKKIYASSELDACTRFIACYSNHVVNVELMDTPENGTQNKIKNLGVFTL